MSDPRRTLLAVRDEIGRVVVGQDGVVSGLLTALIVGGHVLLEGVPGTGKTLLAKSLSAALSLQMQRVQFTPDLMPSDVTGQLVYEQDAASFRFREGPVFTNVLLADEVNRTPPKTQAALLEAMEERQVSVRGEARPLPDPFLVVATQNPIEYEGTYPLPEAQLDRFLLKLVLPYASAEQESEVLQRHDAGMDPHDVVGSGVRQVASGDDLTEARRAARQVRMEPAVRDYVVALVRATRDSPSLTLGASTRGAVMLLHAAKAWAWLSARAYATPDDVKVMARPVLRHRVQLRPEVQMEGSTADRVLDGILASVPVPR